MKNAYCLYSVLLIVVCSCQRPDSASSSVPQTHVSSYSSECQHFINTFSEVSIYKITRQLQQVNERRNGIPEDLKALYPDARDAWNGALGALSSSSLETYQGSYRDRGWEDTYLSNSQKFFFLLTEYAEGNYPQGSKDTFKQAAWVESADIKKRFDALLNYAERSCLPVHLSEIKAQLHPKKLPENIEDCLVE